ncbi:hypothetical protein SAMN05660841_04074 [Sphingobacterium nematocida]|uniref:Uncharacterized protein n=1 Tax=Sphingobacterium nematocida TaxID=1513896 RepID=A0A1T5GHT2_9SPHI|nr:hypothetical protein [Sphingobacterium nematocida]SKC07945.1 hypothetical protein SAMN05660841_04074 [Sphingobacterium nematocida]
MKTLLKHKASRRSFLILMLTILFGLFLIRVIIHLQTNNESGNWIPLITSLIENSIVSLLVTVLIGLFLFYIELPDEEKKFEIIEPFKMKEIFEKEAISTELWFFSGGMGRYTRYATIPKLSESAKRTNEHKSLKLQFIDPKNNSLCEKYAEFRKSLKSAEKETDVWTLDYVKWETIATIVVASIYKSQNPLLDLQICLKNNFSTMRIDMSSSAAIITKEDKSEAAIICRKGSFLYRTYKEEILHAFKQYELLKISLNSKFDLHNLNEADIKMICEQLNINQGLNSNDYQNILRTINDKKEHYG